MLHKSYLFWTILLFCYLLFKPFHCLHSPWSWNVAPNTLIVYNVANSQCMSYNIAKNTKTSWGWAVPDSGSNENTTKKFHFKSWKLFELYGNVTRRTVGRLEELKTKANSVQLSWNCGWAWQKVQSYTYCMYLVQCSKSRGKGYKEKFRFPDGGGGALDPDATIKHHICFSVSTGFKNIWCCLNLITRNFSEEASNI